MVEVEYSADRLAGDEQVRSWGSIIIEELSRVRIDPQTADVKVILQPTS